MKYVFIGGKNFYSIGGIETYMINLCSNLAQRNHDVIYYCESDKNEIQYLNGFKIVHQKSINNVFINKLFLALKASIKSLLIDTKVDIYHYNATGPALFSWIPILFGKNVIVQSHGLEWKRTKWTSLQRRLLKALHNFVISFNKNIIAVSEEQTEYIKLYNKKKSVTITCAVNIPKISIKSEILTKFNLNREGYFLYLGRLVKEKNPDILIDSFIKSGILNKKLVIAGDNDSDKKFVNYLHQKAKQNPNIIFTGAVRGDDKEMLLKECFVFCIPSTLEGLPITLLEAMSYSKICIASDIPACREALNNNGVYVSVENVEDLVDKMRYVINYYEVIRDIRLSNLKRIKEQFTWDKIVAKYESYCKSIT